MFSVSQTDLDFCFYFVANHNHVAPAQMMDRESLTFASK